MPCLNSNTGTLAIFFCACALGTTDSPVSANAAEALAARKSGKEVCCQFARAKKKEFTTRAVCKARRGKIISARQCRQALRLKRRALTPRTRKPAPGPGGPTDRSIKDRSTGRSVAPFNPPGTIVAKTNQAKITLKFPPLVSNAYLNYGGWQAPCTASDKKGKTCYWHTVKPGDDRVPVEVSASCPSGAWIEKIKVGNPSYHEVITIRPRGQKTQFNRNLKVVRTGAMTFYKNVCRRAYDDPSTDQNIPNVQKRSITVNYYKEYGYLPHRMVAAVFCEGYNLHTEPSAHGVPPDQLSDAIADVHANEVITCHSDYWH